MDAEAQMKLAAELKDRLDAYVLSAGFRDRFMDAMESALEALEGDVPAGVSAAQLDEQAFEIAVDSMLFDRPSPGRRTLVECYSDFHRSLTTEDRRMLDRWRDGGIPGAFEILAVSEADRRIRARHLGNGLEYRLVLSEAMYEKVPARMRAGNLLTGRAMPVGDEWLLVGIVSFWPDAAQEYVAEVARDVARINPESMFANPELLARARELVARHHEVFTGLFGGTVVEGEAEEITAEIMRFLVEVDFRHDGDWAPARDVMREYHVMRDDAFERLIPGAGQGGPDEEDGDGVLYRLVHHPVKGLRLLGDEFGLVETMHRSATAVNGIVGRVLTSILDDGDFPSFVLRDFADRYPDRARELYRTALGRPDFDVATDLDPLLRAREPGCDPDLPAIAILPPAFDRSGAATARPAVPGEPTPSAELQAIEPTGPAEPTGSAVSAGPTAPAEAGDQAEPAERDRPGHAA